MGTKSCSRKSSRMEAMRLGAVACSRKRRFICSAHVCVSTEVRHCMTGMLTLR